MNTSTNRITGIISKPGSNIERLTFLLAWGHGLQNLDLSTKARQFIEEK